MKRPPLDELISLWQSAVAAEGTTTGPGAAAGNSFIDAGLAGVGANSFVSMLAVLYPGQPRLVDSFDITGFDNVTGEVTLSTAYKGVAAPIPAGVPYKIVTFRFVPAEVAALTALVVALMADAGDASASTLGSIYGILGNPPAAQDLATRIGYQGATSLADKLTAVRAALLDRLSIITAGGAGELTAARALLLDNLDALLSSRAVPGDAMDLLAATIIAIRQSVCAGGDPAGSIGKLLNDYLDAAISSRAASATALSTATWTAALAAELEPTAKAKLQIKATTIDLNQAAATYDLFTATTQDVVVEKLVLRMPNSALAAPFTYLTIQTDDTTPIVLIDATTGAVGNLTAEAQLAWTGAILLDAGTSAKIRLTIAVAFGGAATVADVIAECRAVVAGGYLA